VRLAARRRWKGRGLDMVRRAAVQRALARHARGEACIGGHRPLDAGALGAVQLALDVGRQQLIRDLLAHLATPGPGPRARPAGSHRRFGARLSGAIIGAAGAFGKPGPSA
jgi:hypothetical protein